ncbi:MAG: DNA mismatch repair protein MutS [Lachnospiraceae bacterium]|jgi:DNA mismatch repair ATPase MutS|nr:DNA mismatch repair protein MutS [Lachnospiraceae bacterium]
MSSEAVGIIIIVAIILAATGLTMTESNRRKKERFRRLTRTGWGKPSDTEYTAEEFSSISHYAQRKEQAFSVDDITWNDLDMDSVYLQANRCMSSCGDDVLWEMMRSPSFSSESLDERDQLAETFSGNEDVRFKCQMILSDIGRMRTMSVYDYILLLRSAKNIGTLPFAALAIATLADIVFLFFMPLPAVLILCVLIIVNISVSLRMHSATQVYITSFQCILRLLNAADAFRKIKDPCLEKYVRSMNRDAEAFSAFRRGAFLVTSSAQVANGLTDVLLEYVKMFFHVDLIKFDQMLNAYRGHEEECFDLIENIGTVDACISIASFRISCGKWCRPEFKDDSDCSIRISDMAHPLIENPVTNSIDMTGGNLVTGSNASGKSTFLKNIAISAILAQSIDTVTASEYRAPFLRVMTSMALADNLQSGESYFIVEIKSLKRILDAAKDPAPLLCIIDEVLRGTNTIERIAASSQILKSLSAANVLSFAATHDIELSYILERIYTNWHFEEEIQEHDVVFNFHLKTGRATTRNAIKLLEVLDYDPAIVEGAREAAARFEQTGEWKL